MSKKEKIYRFDKQGFAKNPDVLFDYPTIKKPFWNYINLQIAKTTDGKWLFGVDVFNKTFPCKDSFFTVKLETKEQAIDKAIKTAQRFISDFIADSYQKNDTHFEIIATFNQWALTQLKK